MPAHSYFFTLLLYIHAKTGHYTFHQRRAQLLRQERDNFRTDKRRKMVDDLQQREIFAETHRSQEQQARDRLEREIDRLRKKAAERQAAKQAAANEQQNPEKKSAQDGHTDLNYIPSAPQQDQIELPLAKTLKVSWSKGIKDYTAADLKSIFGAIGPVEDVVLRDKSKKGSALVIMVDKSDAEAAAVQVLGKVSNPLRITLVNKASIILIFSSI